MEDMEQIDSTFRKLCQTIVVVLKAMISAQETNEKVLAREKEDVDWTFSDLLFCYDSAWRMLEVLRKAECTV